MAKYIIKRERDGREEICVVVPYRDSETGKRRQIWRAASSMTEARGIRDEILKDLREKGSKKYEQRMTLDQYLDEWLEFVKPALRDRTYDDYEKILERYVRTPLGTMKLTEVETRHIQKVANDMREAGYERRTIEYMKTVLSKALKDAIHPPFSLLSFNPAQYVKLPRKKRKSRVWLSEEKGTLQRFLAVLDEDRYGLMFEFALVTGMRPEEYLALQWNIDISFERETASVRQTLYRKRKIDEGDESWWFEEPKNDSSCRLVTLPSYLVQKLRHHKVTQMEHKLKMGRKWKEHDLVFPSTTGTPLHLSNVRARHYQPILKKAGIEGMRLYDLRHSAGSLLHARGVPTKTISLILGHASTRTTEDIYVHEDESMMRQATNTMESIVRKRN